MANRIAVRYSIRPLGDTTVVDQQMFLVHRLANFDIEFSQKTREKYLALRRQHHPDIASLEDQAEGLKAIVAECDKQINRKSQAERRRNLDPEVVERKKVAKAKLKAVKGELKAAVAALRGDPPAWQIKHNEAVKAERKHLLRHARLPGPAGDLDASDLYAGTLALVESVSRQPSSRFKRWNGAGHLRVQVQKQYGIDTRKLFRPNTLVWMDSFPLLESTDRRDRWERGTPRSQMRSTLHFRAKSNEKGNPVWFDASVYVHRPVPDGIVKEAHLLREARHPYSRKPRRWFVNFIIEPTTRAVPCGQVGTAAVDLRWRLMSDQSVCVAYLVDDTGYRHDYRVPRELVEKFKHADALRSEADQLLNDFQAAMKDGFAKWKLATPAPPKEVLEAFATVPNWKRGEKAARLQREHGAKLPQDLAAHLSSFVVEYADLREKEYDTRRRAVNQRQKMYENWAAELAKRYALLKFEDINLTQLIRRGPVEKEAQTTKRQGADYQRIAAPGKFRELCLQAQRSRGVRGVLVEPAGTTIICHACKAVCTFDKANQLDHTCGSCGAFWDQRVNACMNILAAAELPPKPERGPRFAKQKASADAVDLDEEDARNAEDVENEEDYGGSVSAVDAPWAAE